MTQCFIFFHLSCVGYSLGKCVIQGDRVREDKIQSLWSQYINSHFSSDRRTLCYLDCNFRGWCYTEIKRSRRKWCSPCVLVVRVCVSVSIYLCVSVYVWRHHSTRLNHRQAGRQIVAAWRQPELVTRIQIQFIVKATNADGHIPCGIIGETLWGWRCRGRWLTTDIDCVCVCV